MKLKSKKEDLSVKLIPYRLNNLIVNYNVNSHQKVLKLITSECGRTTQIDLGESKPTFVYKRAFGNNM